MKLRMSFNNSSIKELLLVTILGMIGTIFWEIHLGMDFNPDLINYHLYSGYLATHPQRLVNDIFPAGIQGYLNPYIYVLFFTLYKLFSPKIVGIILSALHGLCFISIYVIAKIMFENWDNNTKKIAAFTCAFFGIINPFFLAMIGSSFSDNLTPPLILLPLAIVLTIRFSHPEKSNTNSYIWLLGAGLLVGFSVGFKLTNCAFAIAFVPAWLISFRGNKKQFFEGIIFFTCIGLGFLLINGAWMWTLYHAFNNPTFPFYNNIFRSNMLEFVPTNVPAQAAATSIFEALAYPFRWAHGIPPLSEWKFYDTRYAIISVLLAMLILVRMIPQSFRTSLQFKLANKFSLTIDENPPLYLIHRYWFLFFWCLTSYIFWIDQFGAMRYLMPVTLLTGVIILLCLTELIPYQKVAMTIWVLLALIVISLIHAPGFGRVKFRFSWYPVKIPQQLLQSKNTLYMQEDQLPSLVIPFLPDDSQYIGLLYFKYIEKNEGFRKRAQDIVSHHQGIIRTLSMPGQMYLDPFFDDQLQSFGLRRNPNDCVNISTSNHYLVQSCRIERITSTTASFAIPVPIELRFDQPRSSWVKFVQSYKGQEPDGILIDGKKGGIYLLGTLPKHFKIEIRARMKNGNDVPLNIIIGNQQKQFMIGKTLTQIEFPVNLANNKITEINFKIDDSNSYFILNTIKITKI